MSKDKDRAKEVARLAAQVREAKNNQVRAATKAFKDLLNDPVKRK